MQNEHLFNRVTRLVDRIASPLAGTVLRLGRKAHSAEELEGFKRCQRLAYDCAEHVAGELKPGWSEKRAARLMDEYLRDHGARGYFHRSFAWFGERSGFEGIARVWDFLPTHRAYREEDVVILDTAPVLE